MKTHILTLFGEEIIPEELNTVSKSRPAKKKKEKKADTEDSVEEETQEAVETPPVVIVLPEEKEGRQYYAIGEVAAMLQVKTSNIRFWTKEFNLKVRTTRKGDRMYTPDQLKELRTIYYLVKEKKYTINGAKEKLKNQRNVTMQSVDLKNSLMQLRNKLLLMRNQLV